jgi:tryptophanyl-tRNA synthetase
MKKRVVSGMRTTGALHLGHYHGVLKNWLTLQHQHECFFFMADWHALTTHYDASKHLLAHRNTMLIDWLSVGINPQMCHIFVQSRVPEHAVLHLLLSMITPISWLERVPTYKDQQEKLKEKDLATYGFLGYPLLQSADILIYKANQVPVGEDQVAHIELTREIARRFNHLYAPQKSILPEPAALLTPHAKMPGLDGQKMSKSYHNTIGLREDPASVYQKIKVMPTDPARIRRSDPGEPTCCPVYPFHQLYSSEEVNQWVLKGCRTAGIGCLDCKKAVCDTITAHQAPFIETGKAWEEQPQELAHILEAGIEKARTIACHTLTEVQHAMGLV